MSRLFRRRHVELSDPPEALVAHVRISVENAFGAERVAISTTSNGARAVVRESRTGEPVLVLVVSGTGAVSTILGGYENDDHDDWDSVLATVADPRVIDVHGGDGSVHCFVLNGAGGSALFTKSEGDSASDGVTESWLQSLDGWETAH